jgi:hypothetical protein
MEHTMKRCTFLYNPEKQCFYIENHKHNTQLMFPSAVKTLVNLLPSMIQNMVDEQREWDEMMAKYNVRQDLSLDVSRLEKLLADKMGITKIVNTSKDGKFSLRLYNNTFKGVVYTWLKLYAPNEETGEMEEKSGGTMCEKDDNIQDLKNYVFKVIPKAERKKMQHTIL